MTMETGAARRIDRTSEASWLRPARWTGECSRRGAGWKARAGGTHHVTTARNARGIAHDDADAAREFRACRPSRQPVDAARANQTAAVARRAGHALSILSAQRLPLACDAAAMVRGHARPRRAHPPVR